MAKKIKAECITQNNNTGSSSATFAVREKKQPAAAPGSPGAGNIAVLFTANFVWKDDTAKAFTPGKEYTITIE